VFAKVIAQGSLVPRLSHSRMQTLLGGESMVLSYEHDVNRKEPKKKRKKASDLHTVQPAINSMLGV